MKIVLDHILAKPLELKGIESVESFPALLEVQASGECIFTAPVSYDVVAAKEFDHIRVTGSVNTAVKLSCSRCLSEYDYLLDSSFTIIYRRGVPDSNLSEEDETELTEEDLIASTFSGDDIDLTHDLEEQIVMAVPLKPLCSEQCKGLCPECGMDLNHSGCNCTEKAFNFKFSALKDFKVK